MVSRRLESRSRRASTGRLGSLGPSSTAGVPGRIRVAVSRWLSCGAGRPKAVVFHVDNPPGLNAGLFALTDLQLDIDTAATKGSVATAAVFLRGAAGSRCPAPYRQGAVLCRLGQ